MVVKRMLEFKVDRFCERECSSWENFGKKFIDDLLHEVLFIGQDIN